MEFALLNIYIIIIFIVFNYYCVITIQNDAHWSFCVLAKERRAGLQGNWQIMLMSETDALKHKEMLRGNVH